MKTYHWVLLVAGVVLALWVIIPTIINNVKEPAFTTLATKGNISVRAYAPYIVAEVSVMGNRRDAANQGFRLLANYIFGGNQSRNQEGAEKIAMTAPVIVKPTGEKIAMTAPVIQNTLGDNKWIIQFVMPADYSMETLPTPDDKQVWLREMPPSKWLVIKFSGLAGNDTIMKKQQSLLDYITANNLETVGDYRLAFYNAPWTLPFLRRNEVMIEIR